MRLIFIPALQLGNLSDASDGRISLDTDKSNIATEMVKIRRMWRCLRHSLLPPRRLLSLQTADKIVVIEVYAMSGDTDSWDPVFEYRSRQLCTNIPKI